MAHPAATGQSGARHRRGRGTDAKLLGYVGWHVCWRPGFWVGKKHYRWGQVMGNDSYNEPFSADDDPLWQSATMLQGAGISPAPAQSLVAPPPDSPPPTQPGQATPLTGNLAAAPAQATPKTAPAPAEENAAVATSYRDQLKTGRRSKIRHGLAAYFSSGIGDKENKPKTDQGKAAFSFPVGPSNSSHHSAQPELHRL